MKLHHIGIIVSNLLKSVKMYSRMGYELNGNIVIDSIQNNYIAFMSAQFSPNVELIMPLNNNSSIRNFKDGYHHICYEAEQNENIIENFKKMKVGKIFTSPVSAPGISNRKVVFACLQNGTLIELILWEGLNE